jgi:hypothetical protein
MRSLEGISGESTAMLEFMGGKGQSLAKMAIKTGREYRAEYLKLIPSATNPTIGKETVIVNNGLTATMRSDTSWSPKMPSSSYTGAASTNPADFATQFPREIFAAVGGGHPFTDLIKGATAAGLTVNSEERYVSGQGHTMLQRRILINRSPAEAKKKGALDIEIVADGSHMLPVTIRSNIEAPQKQPTRIMWTALWRKLAPGQGFASNEFTIPTQKGPASRKA